MNDSQFHKTIQAMLGLKNESTIRKWMIRVNQCPPATARRLEELTGIDRVRFLYPDEFPDPWVELRERMGH